MEMDCIPLITDDMYPPNLRIIPSYWLCLFILIIVMVMLTWSSVINNSHKQLINDYRLVDYPANKIPADEHNNDTQSHTSIVTDHSKSLEKRVKRTFTFPTTSTTSSLTEASTNFTNGTTPETSSETTSASTNPSNETISTNSINETTTISCNSCYTTTVSTSNSTNTSTSIDPDAGNSSSSGSTDTTLETTVDEDENICAEHGHPRFLCYPFTLFMIVVVPFFAVTLICLFREFS